EAAHAASRIRARPTHQATQSGRNSMTALRATVPFRRPTRIRPIGLVLAAVLVVGSSYAASWVATSSGGPAHATRTGRDDSFAIGAADEASGPADLAA